MTKSETGQPVNMNSIIGARCPDFGIEEGGVMAIVVETGLRRHGMRRQAGSVMSQFRHAAGICTIVSSFTFLFALVIGLIQ
ncbi:hypothetical protein [Rhizobium leguminosarum]|nr:hypothetical protein [Rhizobium leguminosarum]